MSEKIEVYPKYKKALELEVQKIISQDTEFVDASQFRLDGDVKNYTLLVNSFQLAGGKLSEEYLNARAEQNRREASFEQLSFNWWSGGICYRERTPAQ